MTHRLGSFFLLVAVALAAGCGGSSDDGGAVTSSDEAREAYQGLDEVIDKAITLGFQGFNDATSANIPDETGDGDKAGKLTVAGQVDQGASDNKTMNLAVHLAGYSDDGTHTYDSSSDAALSMKLSKIPTGTLDGSLDGTFAVSGALTGTVTLTVAFTSDLQPDPKTMDVERKPGTTMITGTATSGDSSYAFSTTD